MTTSHIVQFSGGISSWGAARIVKDELMVPGDELVLLFADTLIEDEDTYAFLEAAAEDLDTELTRIADGRDIWQVFRDERFLGNSRIDPCSKILKRELLRRYIEEHFTPEATIIYLGIDWTEQARLDRARPRWEPWRLEAPLTTATVTKDELLADAKARGLPTQRLYTLGLPHANCGGGCVKAGKGHFTKLLQVMPARFKEWETNEAGLIDFLDRDVSILRDTDGSTLTLAELRRRVELQPSLNLEWEDDLGGCGCAID